MLTALTAGTDTGVANLVNRVGGGVTIGQLLGGRSLSLYAANFPGLTTATPDIMFPTWNLRDIYASFNGSAMGTNLPFPLVPAAFTFGAAPSTKVMTLPGGGSTWYELSGTQAAAQLLRLEGSAGGALPSNLRLAIARLQ